MKTFSSMLEDNNEETLSFREIQDIIKSLQIHQA